MWKESNWACWRVVAKLDPDKHIDKDTMLRVAGAGFDAIMVGGTQGITREKTLNLLGQIRQSGYQGPVVQEVTIAAVIAQGSVQAYFLPLVLNAGNILWLSGLHHQAIKRYGDRIPWDITVAQGYVICNSHSAAGRLTGTGPVSVKDVLAYCDLAENMLGLPLLYLEYSGVFGDPALVETVARHRKKIHLFYGGGINSADRARIMAALVDTIVVGNVIYENPASVEGIVNAARYL
ncbi:MAG: hypothetical protein VR67_12925 [Peptococcaceae bacterium BRH_c8a]|nr:MAG: hypothetical protein VR67_12925 [Peptococcaceae bacterium BRH_c8a]